MKKILLSITILSVAAVLAVLGSRAFFSDTETSTGNVFQAGAIDLKIDNQSWYHGPSGTVYQDGLSWQWNDLTDQLFFNFVDLKPGDWGEDTISIHVRDNPAYVCADVTVTSNLENTLTDPELELGDSPEIGELPSELNFVWWADDDDNVLEDNETVITESNLGDAWLNQSHTVALADSQTNIWTGTPGPIVGGPEFTPVYYIGKAWCYGEITLVPQTQGDNSPETHPGILCDGEPVTNISQSDSATLDLSFTAVQARHNEGFICENDYVGDTTFLRLENKTVGYDPILGDGVYGTLRFKSPYPTFNYTLEVYGLQANTEYHLHYYADPWPSTLGIAIATFTTNASGNYSGSGDVELNTDLAVPGDANSPNAKIWVIPTAHWGGTGTGMTNWDQTQYLWEWNVVQYDDTEV